MTDEEFYKRIEGRNEDETAKAMVSLSIITIGDSDDDIQCSDNVSVYDGAVYLAVSPNNLSMIDVMFDEPTDFDYLQVGGICEKFSQMLSDYNAFGGRLPMLNIVICEQGDFQSSLNVLNAVWSYIPTSADKICTGVRLIALTDNLNFVELTDEQVDTVLDEVGDDLLQEQ